MTKILKSKMYVHVWKPEKLMYYLLLVMVAHTNKNINNVLILI